MFMPFLHGALVKFGSMALSFLGANALQFVFDAADEVVESLLEKEELKAKITPDKSDDRRLAVLRKYFDGWKKFKA